MCRNSLCAMLAVIKTLTETQLLKYIQIVLFTAIYIPIGLEATVGTREKGSLLRGVKFLALNRKLCI
jgi:hypothetical protein